MAAATRRFQPRMASTVVVVLLLPALMSLGFWQLDRAEQKEELLAQFQRNAKDTAVAVDGTLTSLDGFRYRQAVASGHFLADRQVLLDNQFSSTGVGYHVFTPMQVNGVDALLLVNRGWVPLGVSRTKLPDIDVADALVHVKGLLSTPPEVGMRLGSVEQAFGRWPLVAPYLDIEFLAQSLGTQVLPYVLLLDPADAHGYTREWRIVSFPPEKNLGYAFQWFAMAAALAILYIYVSLRRRGPEIGQ